MYLDANGNLSPDRSIRGHRAVGVPGTVSGLEYVREKYGKAAEIIGAEFVKRESKKDIDQGKTSPSDQLEQPVFHPFIATWHNQN